MFLIFEPNHFQSWEDTNSPYDHIVAIVYGSFLKHSPLDALDFIKQEISNRKLLITKNGEKFQILLKDKDIQNTFDNLSAYRRFCITQLLGTECVEQGRNQVFAIMFFLYFHLYGNEFIKIKVIDEKLYINGNFFNCNRVN